MKALSALLISLLLLGTPAALRGQDCDFTVLQVETQDGAQAISLVLVGDVEMQDAASDLNALTVRVNADVSVFSGPGSTFDELGVLSAGQTAQVNAGNCTHQWLRTVLEDGQVGWISAGYVTVLGDESTLPVATLGTPVYASMQAFTLVSGTGTRACTDVPEDGVLVQVPAAAEAVPLEVNQVPMLVSGTLFVQSEAGVAQTIEVLSGSAQVTVDDFTVTIRAGMRAVIALTGGDLSSEQMRVEPFSLGEVTALPVYVLPEVIDVVAALIDDAPQIVGMETCRVISDSTENVCPIHFVNRDGDAITRIDVALVSAPQGEWSGSTHENPSLVMGDNTSGALVWGPTCQLGANCFIGPVLWSITLTDAAGNVSDPFEVSFNCVDP